ncbi:hypothetical protein CspeluHIS016_0100140 [Cutaneotrichosporon spelunceum]|uniref:Uncharacterized protein n=1 Tax=Cutaneotrichosporon spelunceum TaxID=1672016 RepID=A0AAD3TLH5_9TREE|nr:hypothetical protein CspeluHIS016_0100140 [Cutaneotrichosporon spelunceum]
MKVAVLAALATATVAIASPVALDISKRQGPGFPTSCTSVCDMFFPVYNSCKNSSSQAAFELCLQPICSEEAWPKLGPCLTCWGAATGESTIPLYGTFIKACS